MEKKTRRNEKERKKDKKIKLEETSTEQQVSHGIKRDLILLSSQIKKRSNKSRRKQKILVWNEFKILNESWLKCKFSFYFLNISKIISNF